MRIRKADAEFIVNCEESARFWRSEAIAHETYAANLLAQYGPQAIDFPSYQEALNDAVHCHTKAMDRSADAVMTRLRFLCGNSVAFIAFLKHPEQCEAF